MAEETELNLHGNVRKQAGDVVWFEPVEPLGGIGRLIMTTRCGGYSRAPYESLNLGFHVQDVEERVRQNRRVLGKLLGEGLHEPVVGEQVHSATVRPIGELHAGTRWNQNEKALAATDGLVTIARRLPLVTLVADCLPIALVDPQHGVGAAVHAGWRGLAAGILENALELMSRTWATEPADVIAWVGPSIGPCCYEVGPEVAAQFPHHTVTPSPIPPHTDPPTLPHSHTPTHLDLPAAARTRLQSAGLLEENLTGLPLCTACHPDLFFSHRRATQEGLTTTGRQALVLWLE